jgi:D-sedoheptulose 7-phosphate isomerase
MSIAINHSLGTTYTGAASEYTQRYFEEVQRIAAGIDPVRVDRMVDLLVETREKGGRLFFIGVGGGAGHAGHAVNDFRKIAGIESYAPTDNVSELTARINDDGWDTCYANWLRGSRLRANDCLFVFSVGGGNLEKNPPANIVQSLKLAKEVGAKVLGVVGRDGGYTAQVADGCVVIPTLSPDTVTAHAEAFQAVVWHLIVSHPDMKKNEMKWESTK